VETELMHHETKTFRISDQFLQVRRKRFYLAFLVSIGFLAAWALLNRTFVLARIGETSPLLMGLFALLIISFWLVRRRWINRHFFPSQLHINEVGLTQGEQGAGAELRWDDIRKVCIWNNSQGEVHLIQIFSKKRPPTFLVGFESIQDIAQHIQAALPVEIEVSHRVLRIDWFGAYALAGIVTVFSVTAMLLQYFFGLGALRFFWFLICIVCSLFLLLRRPASRLNPRLLAADILLGVLFLIRALRLITFQI
jgi:hypothetical protein